MHFAAWQRLGTATEAHAQEPKFYFKNTFSVLRRHKDLAQQNNTAVMVILEI